MKEGRKIPVELENPLDNQIIKICEQVTNRGGDVWYTITPNVITVFRAAVFLPLMFYVPGGGCIWIPVFYFLDCLDGYVARSTDQVTVLGDILDHSSDLMMYAISAYRFPRYLWLLVAGAASLGFHLGLQQKVYQRQRKTKIETLDILTYPLWWVKDPYRMIRNVSRYIGCGTFVLLLALSCLF